MRLDVLTKDQCEAVRLRDEKEFADIPGFEGLYAIDQTGRIVSYAKRSGLGMRNDCFLKPWIANGYWRVTLRRDGRSHHLYVHRLVALAHLPNPNGLLEINHKDGDKRNCHLLNLEWCTQRENVRHAFATGLAQITDVHRHAQKAKRKLSFQQATEIRRAYTERLASQRELSRQYGVSQTAISAITRSKTYLVESYL